MIKNTISVFNFKSYQREIGATCLTFVPGVFDVDCTLVLSSLLSCKISFIFPSIALQHVLSVHSSLVFLPQLHKQPFRLNPDTFSAHISQSVKLFTTSLTWLQSIVHADVPIRLEIIYSIFIFICLY